MGCNQCMLVSVSVSLVCMTSSPPSVNDHRCLPIAIADHLEEKFREGSQHRTCREAASSTSVVSGSGAIPCGTPPGLARRSISIPCYRTGCADLPHSALGQDVMPPPTAGGPVSFVSLDPCRQFPRQHIPARIGSDTAGSDRRSGAIKVSSAQVEEWCRSRQQGRRP